ncbi:hypothetical protein ACQKGO_28330 [Corallococcus interemptor]|uniref:hypothetical protein n=1 Tax=Corallococcus interemptor TaxID=2316720 RepID=UPI003CFC6C62
MASFRRDVLEIAGTSFVSLERGRELRGVLKEAWRVSTHFAFVRYGRMRVDGADVVVPTPELKRVQHDFQLIKAEALEGRWVKSWPGTVTASNGALWVRFRKENNMGFALDESLLWRGFGGWEDLQLFEKGKLRIFVCSHEGFGKGWGDEKYFKKINVEPDGHLSESYELAGDPIAPSVWDFVTQGR